MVAEDGEGELPVRSAEAVAAAGQRAGKSLRQFAVDLFGAARVDAEWTPDDPTRSKVRRLLHRARTESGGGPLTDDRGTPMTAGKDSEDVPAAELRAAGAHAAR